ncbi:acyl-CoA dehydrogenase family protein [Roseococcus thiosulfatophilus]|uniref:acyl-CoA dehydrogenase family protein n=1 Tax=Roseococcus thiosulfatophilus TaxID=35813 RepID=UPI001A8CC4E5|nr:acyl-CoA dehydrogenase family protein [Roseococcus thiosulfatophilus]
MDIPAQPLSASLDARALDVAAALRAAPPRDAAAALDQLAPLLPLARAAPRVLWQALVTLGHADLSAGRLFEGHVNVLRLLDDHGDAAQRARAEGAGLLAIWGADDPASPVLLEAGRLSGRKLFCSGAASVGAALVTARTPEGPVLVWVERPAATRFTDGPAWPVGGMRASESRACALDGLEVRPGDVVGGLGDYLAQPAFSGGIWRILALQLGAMRRLDEALRAHLLAHDRAGHPAQRARLMENALDLETTRLWTLAAAEAVEAGQDTEAALARVGLAREVTTRAAEGVLARTRRGIGLPGSVMEGTPGGAPVERLARDLDSFLRQPGPDAALDRATDILLARGARVLG